MGSDNKGVEIIQKEGGLLVQFIGSAESLGLTEDGEATFLVVSSHCGPHKYLIWNLICRTIP